MDQLNLLLVTLAGLGASAITGVLKKVDTSFSAKLGNYTPILVTLLTFILPKITTALGLTQIPDAVALANAPLATCVAIAARELLVKLKAGVTPATGAP